MTTFHLSDYWASIQDHSISPEHALTLLKHMRSEQCETCLSYITEHPEVIQHMLDLETAQTIPKTKTTQTDLWTSIKGWFQETLRPKAPVFVPAAALAATLFALMPQTPFFSKNPLKHAPVLKSSSSNSVKDLKLELLIPEHGASFRILRDGDSLLPGTQLAFRSHHELSNPTYAYLALQSNSGWYTLRSTTKHSKIQKGTKLWKESVKIDPTDRGRVYVLIYLSPKKIKTLPQGTHPGSFEPFQTYFRTTRSPQIKQLDKLAKQLHPQARVLVRWFNVAKQ